VNVNSEFTFNSCFMALKLIILFLLGFYFIRKVSCAILNEDEMVKRLETLSKSLLSLEFPDSNSLIQV